MPTLLVIAVLARAIHANDFATTSRMLAILERRLPIEEVFALLDTLSGDAPPPPLSTPDPRIALCA